MLPMKDYLASKVLDAMRETRMIYKSQLDNESEFEHDFSAQELHYPGSVPQSLLSFLSGLSPPNPEYD